MKKYILIIVALFVGVISVKAISSDFDIDSSNLFLSTNGKNNSILDNFNDDYSISYSATPENADIKEEITELSKKVTYLLLGDFNNKNESNEEYYRRHQDYLDMGAYRYFPQDKNTSSGYDETIPNYRYAYVSEFSVPSMFLQFNELDIIYNSYGNIEITVNDNLVISTVTLPKVRMKEENSEDPYKYDIVETNLVITYYFLRIGDEYKLCHLFGETTEQLNSYFTVLENDENRSTMQVAPSYDSNLKDIYDYSKLDLVTDEEIDNIYNKNKSNVVILSSYYNNYSVASSNGFFINEGLVVTTWDFIEKSLIEAQYIAIKDGNGISYGYDGIVTANPDANIVVIKLKEKVGKRVDLGNYEALKKEDPIFTLSSKTGVGLTIQKGIIVLNEEYIQSAIPLSQSDEGSPLLDKSGNVVGINTSKQVNTSISIAVNSKVLLEIQNKFNNIEFNSIKFITFNELKEQFYYVKYNDEIIDNNISSRKWKEYSKIGNIEDNIKLKLLKASYKDKVVSLRYENNISEYMSSMQLASAFKEKLVEDGYKEILSSNKKCIYKNDNYQVIIMDDFDYLIIVMVKL